MEGYNNHLERNNRKNCSSDTDSLKQLTPVKSGFHLPLSSNRFNHQTLKMDARLNNSLRHRFHYIPTLRTYNNLLHRQQNNDHQNINEGAADEAIKAKIIAHPQYSSLLQAYMDCQKIGAPAEVMARLATIRQEFETRPQQASASCGETFKDPELDQFMECYYNMLVKYREELTRPLQEAMEFMQRIERQLHLLSTDPQQIINSENKCEGITSSEEDQHNSGRETTLPEIDPHAEDNRELKNHLLRKYSGYLSNLKQELSKKKKKGKLPKDARQKLLTWWDLHYKWPYPSEAEKVSLAESSGLDHKQINNWFINQRKRHWKAPSGNTQYMTTVDGVRPHNAALYMEEEDHYAEDCYRFGP